MSLIVTCPTCSGRATLPADAAGKKFRCARCGGIITATADGPKVPAPAASTAGGEELPRSVGGFEVRSWLGEGAFGTVYLGHDRALDRPVALKVPHAHAFTSSQARKRFETEARSAALLRHPHIVPIYAAGFDGTHYFIASQFIVGPEREGAPISATTLEAAMKAKAFSFGESAQVVRDLAEALDYAHGMGIVHRDVKPANVLLDRQRRAHLADFGLAHQEDSDVKLTKEGAVLGTPAYMAPEQARGREADVVAASDQYSLGVVLYELIAGRLPFSGPINMVLSLHQFQEPTPPRKARADVPRDLETICLKAMAKSPAERYASCADMAADLRRWQEGEPIVARRLPPVERLVRWGKRNPVVAGLMALVAVSLIAGTAVSTMFAVRADAEATRANDATDKETEAKESAMGAKEAAERAEKRKDAELTRAEWLLYGFQLKAVQIAWEEGDAEPARQILASCRPDFRNWEYSYLARRIKSTERASGKHASSVNHIALGTNGRRIAIVCGDNLVKICDAETGQEIRSLKGHPSYVRVVAMSAVGKRVVTGSANKCLTIWDAETGQATKTLKGHTDHINGAAISADGRRIVSCSDDGIVKVWDADVGREVRSLKGHTMRVTHVGISADGKLIVSRGDDRMLKLWDAETGREVRTLKGQTFAVTSAVISANGKRVAIGSLDKTVKLWDTETGEVIRALNGHTEAICSIAISADGKRLVSGSGDRTVRAWNVETGREVQCLRGHTEAVSAVAISADGKRIVSGSQDKTVKIWDSDASPNEVRILKGHTSWVTGVAISADGNRVVSGSYDGTVRMWETKPGQEIRTLNGHTDVVCSVAISSDGKRIVSGSNDGTVKVWDAEMGRERYTLKGHTNRVKSVSLSADGTRFATSGSDKTVKVWDAETGREIRTLNGHTTPVLGVAISPANRNRIVSWGQDNVAKIWDSETGREILTIALDQHGFANEENPYHGTISANGKLLICSGDLKVFDLHSGQQMCSLPHSRFVSGVAISRDGKRIISAAGDMVRIWDREHNQELLTLRSPVGSLKDVGFSAKGDILVGAAGNDILLWDALPAP